MDAITFEPIYQQRVWGGRNLETRFGRELPDPEHPYGESWEISGRPDAESRVVRGPFAGQTINELWRGESREKIFEANAPFAGSHRFPLLCKILDARERLSLQVHPPAGIAEELGGEPKNEMWFVAAAEPGAELHAGLKTGVTRDQLAAALEEGSAEALVHRIPVAAGDFIFIPSGRLHAIGAGIVIYEIQQNSDTTYRVFDWNRTGLDGKPRTLHIPESLRCIDFDDTEPRLDSPVGSLLASCDQFRVEHHQIMGAGIDLYLPPKKFAIVTVIAGTVTFGSDSFEAGDFFLVPAETDRTKVLRGKSAADLLLTTWPR